MPIKHKTAKKDREERSGSRSRSSVRGSSRGRANGEGEEESKGNKRGSSRSLADRFDKAKPQGMVDEGKYEALLVNAVLQPANTKGQAVRFTYEIATEGDFQGQRISQFYQMEDAEGNEGKGIGFLKRDLAILGKGDVRFADMEDCFDDLKDDMPGVLVTVKQNGQFTNIYLNGLCEDDVCDDWRDNRPPTPF